MDLQRPGLFLQSSRYFCLSLSCLSLSRARASNASGFYVAEEEVGPVERTAYLDKFSEEEKKALVPWGRGTLAWMVHDAIMTWEAQALYVPPRP